MSDPSAPAPSTGKRVLHWLVRLAGLAIVVWVVSGVDWHDSVVLADKSRVRGELVGEVPRKWDETASVTLRERDGREVAYTSAELHHDESTRVPDVNEGLLRIVRRSDKVKLTIGLVLFGLITLIGITRWWLLLKAQDIHVPYRLAARLTFVGFFFNNVVPGPTGGDVVKAVYIARRTKKRADAVVTVIVDRVVGIVALALIAAFVLAFKLDEPNFRELAIFIALFLGGLAVATMLFFSRRVRRFLRADGLSSRLPGGDFIRRADEAVFRWRSHKRAIVVAILLSFANQICIQGMMILFASALHMTTVSGDPVPWSTFMVVLPVAFIVSALPMLPGGWGIREAAFAVCFAYVGVERNPAIALSVVNGMTQLAWSLLGGLLFLVDRGSPASPQAPPENIEA